MSRSDPCPNLVDWLEQARARCDMDVVRIAWRDSTEWEVDGATIHRRSGGFFRVVGAQARAEGADVDGTAQPLIDQPEVGILGFLLRGAGAACELLVQAKPEPGNVGLVQLAPSVQATESNYKRRHEGQHTPMLDHFVEPGRRVLSDGLQSEQGTRFLGKYNRNAVVETPAGDDGAHGRAYRWFPAREVLDALRRDFTINTDARSVLACGPWRAMAPGRAPFERSRGRGGLGELLWRAYEVSDDSTRQRAEDVVGQLDALRAARRVEPVVRRLDTIAGWRVTDDAVVGEGDAAFEVHACRVTTSDREVPRWDQPILASCTVGRADLLFRETRGVPHFLFRARAELGFREGFQLGPSLQVGPDPAIFRDLGDEEARLAEAVAQTETTLACRQSDEGGRFFRSICEYSIRRWEAPIGDAPHLAWLTLREIEALLSRPGVFTNEARTLISMLLSFL